VPVTVLGVTWLVTRALKDLVPRLHKRGILIYGVYQDAQGRWMVYWHGRKPQVLDWENPPPELIGQGTVIQGMWRKPPSKGH